MGRRVASLLLLASLGTGAAAQESGSRASSPPGCATERSKDRIAGAGPTGEVRLESGRVAVLAGLRLPEDAPERAPATALIASFAGTSVELDSRPADRWSRLPARIRTGPAQADLAELLVEGGLALVDAGEADALCRRELLALEETARERGLGVWAGDRYKPLGAGDLAGLRGRVGQFALVEGRIRSIGERRERTYLNFGSDWSASLTITIPKRTWSIMRERGLSAATLRNRRVRARGVIEEWRGPTIEIRAAEMLELLDDRRGL